MDAEQLEKIRTIQKRDHRPKVMAAQFAAGGDRTLVYGYTVERDTFHLYVKDGRLHRFIYREGLAGLTVTSYEQAASMHARDMVPSKAIYWRRSDYEACWFLAVLDTYMHFHESGQAVIDRTEVPEFEGIVYDPEKHSTWAPRSTANRG